MAAGRRSLLSAAISAATMASAAALAPVGGPLKSKACGAADDGSALLQMGGPSVGGPSACLGTRTSCESQATGVMCSSGRLNIFTMTPKQEFDALKSVADALEDTTPPSETDFLSLFPEAVASGVRMSKGSAEAIAVAMHEATRVAGVTPTLPKESRGIFWLKGGGTSILASYQYAQWHEDKGLYLSPFAPFSAAWIGAKPATWNTISDQIQTLATLSKKFRTCEEGLERTLRPVVCDSKDTEDRMAYASAQVHIAGNLSFAHDFGGGKSDVELTLQKPKGCIAPDWHVTAQQGPAKRDCAKQVLFDFELLQILDSEGEPVEPDYTRFVKAMGKQELVAWSGWTSESKRSAHEDFVANNADYKAFLDSIAVLQC